MYKITIFGIPRSFPSDYVLREAAIDRASRELRSKQYPAYATVTNTETNEEIRLDLSRHGTILENG